MSSEANVRMRHSDANKFVAKITVADQKALAQHQMGKPTEGDPQQTQSAYNDSSLQNSSALKVKNNLNK